MKINSFKRNLAFYLSTVLISGGTSSFAVKRNPQYSEKKVQKCVKFADLLSNIFEVPEDQKNNFYIRKRKTGFKNNDLFIFSLITPEYVYKNMDNQNPKCFNMASLLPSMTKNPCATIYPFLVASLLQFAPYLLKPYKGGPRKSNATYYLSFAHIHLHNPKATLIYPYHLSMLLNNNDKLQSIISILSNTYKDENGSWTGSELASLTIFLHATKILDSFKFDATNRFCKMLNNKNDSNRNIPNMVNPLIDIVNHITDKSYQLNAKKPISQAYKNFYLDIVKAIDPERASLFQLLDNDTNNLKIDQNTNKNHINASNLCVDIKLEDNVDEYEHKFNSGKNKITNKKRIRGFKRFRKKFKKISKNHSIKEKNTIKCTDILVTNNQQQNQLRKPIFKDMNIVFP